MNYRFWGQKVKVQGHGTTECIPDFHVSTISPVSIDRFSSRDTDDLITFFGQKVKVQGRTIAAEAHSTRRYGRVHSTRRYGRVQLFLVNILVIFMWGHLR